MSADNGYIIRQNAEGKYVLQMYFASVGYPPIDKPGSDIFNTLEEAVIEYSKISASDDFVIEYGLTVLVDTPQEKKIMQVEQWSRKPFDVEAVQVTADNMAEVAEWCHGDVETSEAGTYVKVRVLNPMTERQTKGFAGDWILYANRGFKVYTDRAFKSSFNRNANGEASRNVFEQAGAHGSGEIIPD